MTAGGSLIPLPEPLPLPAPSWLLWFLLTLTFVLHVIAMNLLAGGSLIALHARMRYGARPEARALLARFGKAAPVLFAATVTFGVAPLLFLQVLYGRLFFVSSVLMAWVWLAVVAALIVAYYAAYALAFRKPDREAPVWLLGLIAIVLIAVGFIYSNNMTLMLRANAFAAMYAASGAGWQLNLSDPTLLPRWLHMMTGAVAVAGMAIAILGAVRSSKEPQFGAWARRYGARCAVAATSLNVVIGFAWLATLPEALQSPFLGGSVVATAILAIGILLSLLTVATMIALSLDGVAPRLVWVSGGSLGLTLVAMVLARDQLRRAALDGVGFVPATWVASQWLTIGLFAICLVAALATVGWMVWRFVGSTGSAGAEEIRHPNAA